MIISLHSTHLYLQWWEMKCCLKDILNFAWYSMRGGLHWTCTSVLCGRVEHSLRALVVLLMSVHRAVKHPCRRSWWLPKRLFLMPGVTDLHEGSLSLSGEVQLCFNAICILFLSLSQLSSQTAGCLSTSCVFPLTTSVTAAIIDFKNLFLSVLVVSTSVRLDV